MKYPNGLNKDYKKNINYKNRGMNLEDDINLANEYYLIHNIASIYKKPTPIGIVKVDNSGIIHEAYFKTPSTTDYNGIYKGKYIDFEAKETIENNFPLKNIHEHQIKHLNTISNMGGIGFIIVSFVKLEKTFILSNYYLQKFRSSNTRKSIPLKYFEDYGYIVNYKLNPRLDYLKIVDILLEGENNEFKENN